MRRAEQALPVREFYICKILLNSFKTVPCFKDKKMDYKTETKAMKLKSSWILWAHNTRNKNWSIDSFKKLYVVDNIYYALNLAKNIRFMNTGMDQYFIMRDGILPVWEDPKNKEGGVFYMKIPKNDFIYVWQNLILRMFGETLTNESETINGLSIKFGNGNEHKIKIWNDDKEKPIPDVFNPEIKT